MNTPDEAEVERNEPRPVCTRTLREIVARIYKDEDVIVSIHDLMQYVDQVRIVGVRDVMHTWRDDEVRSAHYR